MLGSRLQQPHWRGLWAVDGDQPLAAQSALVDRLFGPEPGAAPIFDQRHLGGATRAGTTEIHRRQPFFVIVQIDTPVSRL